MYQVQLVAATRHQQRWWRGSTCIMILVCRWLWFCALQTPALRCCHAVCLRQLAHALRLCLSRPLAACACWFHGAPAGGWSCCTCESRAVQWWCSAALLAIAHVLLAHAAHALVACRHVAVVVRTPGLGRLWSALQCWPWQLLGLAARLQRRPAAAAGVVCRDAHWKGLCRGSTIGCYLRAHCSLALLSSAGSAASSEWSPVAGKYLHRSLQGVLAIAKGCRPHRCNSMPPSAED